MLKKLVNTLNRRIAVVRSSTFNNARSYGALRLCTTPALSSHVAIKNVGVLVQNRRCFASESTYSGQISTREHTGFKSMLHYAVHKNDPKLLDDLIFNGVRIDVRDDSGQTALHLAASISRNDSHLNMAKVLLQYGADMNAFDHAGKKPIDCLEPTALNKEIEELFMMQLIKEELIRHGFRQQL